MAENWIPLDNGAWEEGAKMGALSRQRRQGREYGAAINAAGGDPGAAASLAYKNGDVEQGAKFQNDGLAQAQTHAKAMLNLANALSTVPYEQRKGKIQSWAPMLQQRFGFTPQQIESVDPTDDWLKGEAALAGQVGNFVKIEEGKDGGIYGYNADGTTVQLRAPPPKVDISPNGVATAQDVNTGSVQVTGQVPGYAVPRQSGGPDGAPPSGYQWRPDGNLEPIAGGPADPAHAPLSQTELRTARDKASALQNLITSMDNATKVLPEHLGAMNMLGVGQDAAKIDAAYKDLQILWKEAANLGALAGPDLDLIKGAIGDPTSIQAGLTGGAPGIRDRLTQARAAALRRLDQLKRYYPQAFEGSPQMVEEPGAPSGNSTGVVAPPIQKLTDEQFEALKRQRGIK